MSRNTQRHLRRSPKRQMQQRNRSAGGFRRGSSRPSIAYRQRTSPSKNLQEPFNAPEDWHEATGRGDVKVVVQKPGKGYVHAVTRQEVLDRIARLPRKFTRDLEVVQLSRMTKKRALFPCYGMQWGTAVYLYPIEESLVETYLRTPKPQQLIETRMHGGVWKPDGKSWKLHWTRESVKDFYLNNILMHEVAHVYDDWNSNSEDRERYAIWFATEYGYRASRGRR